MVYPPFSWKKTGQKYFMTKGSVSSFCEQERPYKKARFQKGTELFCNIQFFEF